MKFILSIRKRPKKGMYEIFTGVAVDDLADAPVELLIKVLPPSTYAVFTMQGQQIISDWHQAIYHEWQPQSGYQVSGGYSFQFYDHRFKGLDRVDESELDVYMPVTAVIPKNG